jgi:hypothetical protein
MAPAAPISLIEHQVAVLREQLGIERGRLNHLMARARDYDQLSARLHELTVQADRRTRHGHRPARAGGTLREEFNAEAVALKLFPVEPDQRASDPLVNAFIDFIDRDRCLCGPLRPAQASPCSATGTHHPLRRADPDYRVTTRPACSPSAAAMRNASRRTWAPTCWSASAPSPAPSCRTLAHRGLPALLNPCVERANRASKTPTCLAPGQDTDVRIRTATPTDNPMTPRASAMPRSRPSSATWPTSDGCRRIRSAAIAAI